MDTLEYWIQLENRPWDASPHSIDRMTGLPIMETPGGKGPVDVTIISPGTGVTKTRKMYNPLRDGDVVKDALILRRYKPPTLADKSDAWTIPDDRKVNPWDLNELDPSDNGTMGTIPGPVLECSVGDTVVVNFRNLDRRTRLGLKEVCISLPFVGEICFHLPTQEPIEIEKRVHSLHPHGFVFKRHSDGAYPLSPPDPGQPILASEATAWAGVPGFSGTLKQGDRVPPEGTFRYEWQTIGWATTAGVWLYHDHSICDMENVELGAIGIIVIHNPDDTEQEVDIRDASDPMKLDPAFLPGGSPNGSPVVLKCFPFQFPDVKVLPYDRAGLGAIHAAAHEGYAHGSPADGTLAHLARIEHPVHHEVGREKGKHAEPPDPEIDRIIKRGDLFLELNEKLDGFAAFCLPRYRKPPSKGLYLQLFHTMSGVGGMAINGRIYLGNTPTIVAGLDTRMRFGVVGMGMAVHTFHIHGHRWIVPGPDGTTPAAIQISPQVRPVSPNEDTRIFGAANSFGFTIDGKAGSFMRAGGKDPEDSIGEWHMHCHDLIHMMTGMMGSLLIVAGNELALALPVGVPCGHGAGGGGEDEHGNGNGCTVHTVNMQASAYSPQHLTIPMGDAVQFVNLDGFGHTVNWDSAGSPPNSGTINPAGSPGDTYTTPCLSSAGTYNFHCEFHGVPGAGMHGSVMVTP